MTLALGSGFSEEFRTKGQPMSEETITVTLSEKECRVAVQAMQELQMRVSAQGLTRGVEECRSASQKITEAIHNGSATNVPQIGSLRPREPSA